MADEPKSEPLKHIIRPTLPWREPTTTECGRPLDDVRAVEDRDEIARFIKKHGKQRAAFMVCMTCAQTSDRWPSWKISPITAMYRTVERARYGDPDSDDVMHRELLAIAKLIELHRDEFDELVADLADVSDLAAARQAKARRRS